MRASSPTRQRGFTLRSRCMHGEVKKKSNVCMVKLINMHMSEGGRSQKLPSISNSDTLNLKLGQLPKS